MPRKKSVEMNRENFLKTWSLGITFDPTLQSFPESLEESFFLIKKDSENILKLKINQGIYLVSIDNSFGVKVDLDINDLEEGKYNWEINIVREGETILFDNGTIDALGKPTKKKIARPWDFLNPNTEYVEEKIAEERLNICKSCEMFLKGICKSCGCYMPLKTRIAHASCPLEKWGEHNG